MNTLIIVDVQNDFLPGGALAVPDGDAVIPVINGMMTGFDLVVATMDWHPPEHGSFEVNGGTWPVHCVERTRGAQLSDELILDRIDLVVKKGRDVERPGYSGFEDTLLGDLLVGSVTVVGLATDYCVKATVLDALSLGLDVTVDLRACRAVEAEVADEARAALFMQARGAHIITR